MIEVNSSSSSANVPTNNCNASFQGRECEKNGGHFYSLFVDEHHATGWMWMMVVGVGRTGQDRAPVNLVQFG